MSCCCRMTRISSGEASGRLLFLGLPPISPPYATLSFNEHADSDKRYPTRSRDGKSGRNSWMMGNKPHDLSTT